jgi:hypothetical protein
MHNSKSRNQNGIQLNFIMENAKVKIIGVAGTPATPYLEKRLR